MALPTRKKQTKKPNTLPKDFISSVRKLFSDQFKKNRKNASFSIFGDLYFSELVLCVSLTQEKNLRAASFHVGCDLDKSIAENPEKITDTLKVMIDLAASWFAQGFEKGPGLEGILSSMKEVDSTWQEVNWENQVFFVKLDRTHYGLEGAADEFLKRAGFKVEEEEAEEELDDDDSGEGFLH